MPTIRETSTDDIEPARRLDLWREGARGIGSMHHDVSEGSRFEGRARLAVFDRLRLGRIATSPHRALWTRDMIRRADDSFLRVVFQCRGSVHVEQGENQFRLHPGQWTVLNASRPHSFRAEEDVEEIILIVPAGVLAPRLFDASRRLAAAHPGNGAVGRMLLGFADVMLASEPARSSGVIDHLEAAGIEMVRALIEDALGAQTASTCREIRIERIRAYVERNLSDPGLNVQRIGDALGCSKRYIHSLFEGGQTVHQLIWGSRLERCARDLRQRDRGGASITTISLSHGFSCPAHFSRMFKARYGIAPRDYRQRWLDS